MLKGRSRLFNLPELFGNLGNGQWPEILKSIAFKSNSKPMISEVIKETRILILTMATLGTDSTNSSKEMVKDINSQGSSYPSDLIP